MISLDVDKAMIDATNQMVIRSTDNPIISEVQWKHYYFKKVKNGRPHSEIQPGYL